MRPANEKVHTLSKADKPVLPLLGYPGTSQAARKSSKAILVGFDTSSDPAQLHANRRETVNIKVCESGFVHYMAYDDDRYDGAPDGHTTSGIGLTEYAAVQDLRDNYEVSEDDEGIMACDIWLMAHREVA